MWGVSRAYRLEADPKNVPPKPIVRTYQTRAWEGQQMDMRKEGFDLEDGEMHLSESTHPNPSQH
jgi:hypothetical protein